MAKIRDRIKEKAKAGKKGGKKTVVDVITSEKVIQSLLTGSVAGIITSFFEGSSVILVDWFNSNTPLFVPAKWALAIMLVFVFYAAYWADNNTDRFREMVEDATGEEANDNDG